MLVAFISAMSLAAIPAFAVSNSGITYQGRIMKPDDTPVAGVHTQFRMQIRTKGSENCVMYEEIQEQDLSSSDGNFSLTLNDGHGARQDTPTYDIDQIFANKGTFTFHSTSCPTTDVTYAPDADDHRILVVEFKDETMLAWEPMPAQTINYVPMALQAKNIAGFGIGNLVRVQEADGSLTNVTPLSNANYDALKLLVAGTSGLYEKPGKLGGITVPSMGVTPGKVLGWDGSAWTVADPIAGVQAFAKTALPACAGGAYLRNNAGALECTTPAAGTTGTVTEIRTGVGLTGGPINDDGDIALATLNAGGTGFKVTYDTYGRVTAAVALVEADIPQLSTAGKVVGSAITSGQIGGSTSMDTTGLIKSTSGSFTALGTQGLQVFKTDNSYSVSIIANPALGANYTLTLPVNGGANGQVLTTNGSGGLSWSNAASGSVTSLTGDVTSTGSGAVATTIASNAVTTGKISDANVTFAKIQNVPTASIVGRYSSGSGAPESLTLGTGLALSAGGVLSSNITDTDTFASALGACANGTVPLRVAGAWTCGVPTPLSTNLAIVQRDNAGSFAANVATVNGLALNNAGSIVNLVNLAGSAYTLTLPVGIGTTGQVLSTSGSGQLTWATPAAPGTGDLKADGSIPMTGNFQLNGHYLSGDGNSEGIFVANDGNVGIGKNNPGVALDVYSYTSTGLKVVTDYGNPAAQIATGNGTALNLQAGGSGATGLYVSTSGAAANAAVVIQQGASQTSDLTRWITSGGTVSSVVQYDGRFGIGTASPATKLEVAGTLKIGNGGELCTAGINGAIRYSVGSLQYCVGTTWTALGAGTVFLSDLKSSASGNPALFANPACASNETLSWSGVTDQFSCIAIGALDASKITTGTMAATRLPAATGTADGILTQVAQSIKGVKTFLDTVVFNGDISVAGNVTVVGGVKFGTVATTCDGTTEGTLRYSSTSKKMEFCNGTSWTSMAQGVISTAAIGAPSSSLVKAAPVSFVVTYNSGTDTGAINLNSSHITIGGTAPSGCTVSSVTGSGLTRTVTVGSCSATGTVNISIAAGSAASSTGDASQAAGPSSTFQVDNTGPTPPATITLGSVPGSTTSSPTISYSAAVDTGGSTTANHQVRIIRISDSAVIQDWTTHVSGNAVSGLSLATSTQYGVLVRGVDALGNIGSFNSPTSWTSTNFTFGSGTYQSGTVFGGGTAVKWTTPGTYSVTLPMAASYTIETVGSGGASGGDGNGAGGGGAYVRKSYNYDGSSTLTITVADGTKMSNGVLWTSGQYTGYGQSSTVSGPSLSLNAGGGGGTSAPAYVIQNQGFAPITYTGGDINLPGTAGQNGVLNTCGCGSSAQGGKAGGVFINGSATGSGGAGASYGGAGPVGSVPGGGAGGSGDDGPMQIGSDGEVRITFGP